MANKKKEQTAETFEDIAAKSNILTYGTDNTLAKEDDETSMIINKTIIGTKEKFGMRTSGKPINYFNELNIGNAFAEMTSSLKEKKKDKEGV